MKRINRKTWTGTATFWKTLSKRSLIVFLAGVFCLFGSFGFILDSSNPQATTAGELTMKRACFAVGWAFFGTHRMLKSMIPHGLLWIRVSQNHNHREGPFWEQEPPVRDGDYSATPRSALVVHLPETEVRAA
jgi:hypothetical protein